MNSDEAVLLEEETETRIHAGDEQKFVKPFEFSCLNTSIPEQEPKPQIQPALKNARIVRVLETGVSIDIGGTIEEAKVAFSCLIQPNPEDTVLYAKNEEGINYILSIIERPGNPNLMLSLPGNATIQTPHGSLNLVSKESVNISASDKLHCVSKEAIHKSTNMLIAFDKITAKGKHLLGHINKIVLVSGLVHSLVENAIKKVKSYVRHSEELDEVKAGQMTRRVEGLYSVKTKMTTMISEESTIIDGERIFTGL